MIIFFSGTGNSKYIAECIGNALNDKIICMNDILRNEDNESFDVCGNLIVVTPTYAWRIPRLVKQFLNNRQWNDVNNVWFVMTCGSEIGNASKYNEELCKKLNFHYKGTAQVIMPENYIAMFKAPEREEAIEIINKTNNIIDEVIDCIKNKRDFKKNRNNIYDRFMSHYVNPLFYRFYVKDYAFKVNDQCISCGKCALNCPLNNIDYIENKPKWNHHCTHCMACMNYCPVKAIEYGKKSVGKVKYNFESLHYNKEKKE